MEINVNDYYVMSNNRTALEGLQAAIEKRKCGAVAVWPSGFPTLDAKLNGGFHGGQLCFLGAVSSLGKTSFALQMAAQIAEQGQDVLIVSLEMSQDDLNAKIVSRYSYQIQTAHRKPDRKPMTAANVLNGAVGQVQRGEDEAGHMRVVGLDPQGDLYAESLEAAQQIEDHLYIIVGKNDICSDDVKNLITVHEEKTGHKPFVILDYLQILTISGDLKSGDRRMLTDYDVITLKNTAREMQVPMLVVSAFNRTSYTDPVNMGSFKESGLIEYTSDVLLGMQYQGMDYERHKAYVEDPETKKKQLKIVSETKQDHDVRVRQLLDQMDFDGAEGKALPIELKILKHRMGSKGTINFSFIPAYGMYADKGIKEPNDSPVVSGKSGKVVQDSEVVTTVNGKSVKGAIR